MNIQIIYLEEDDDLHSVKDRLNWVQERRVLLVLPASGDLLAEFLDLAMLHRRVDELNLELGLVTADHRVLGQSKALGIPTFSTVRSATRSRRGWWRGRYRRESIGQPTRLDEDDFIELAHRKRMRPVWQQWLFRYLAIIIALLTFSILFISAIYAIPGATIALQPETQTVHVRKQLVADPELEGDTDNDTYVSGRVIRSTQEWQAEVDTTGTIEVADSPSSGSVVFVNQLNQSILVPAGTRVSTTAGDRIVFQTTSDIEVPGFSGGAIEVSVVATEPGIGGNVKANRINRIEGPLSLQLDVRNLEPTTGGGARIENAVSDADIERLRSHVMQQLQVRALAEMESKLLGGEFLARDSLRVEQVVQETFSNFAGEQSDTLVLEITAELQATAVDELQAVGLVYELLSSDVQPGYDLVPQSLRFESGEIQAVDEDGKVTFEMFGEGIIAAEINEQDLLEDISGQPVGAASAYLFENLPLRNYPSIYLWPDWFGRLPYLPIRIRSEIDLGF